MHNELVKSCFRVLPFLAVIVIITILLKKRRLNSADIGLQKPASLKQVFICVGIFMLYVLAIEFLLYKCNWLQVVAWSKPMLPSVILISGIAVLAPIAEELLFRGLLLFKFSKRLNRHFAIVIISVFFVALHNFSYQNTLSSNIGIAQSFIDALLYSYARYYTKSLYTPIAMHTFGNVVAVVERFIF